VFNIFCVFNFKLQSSAVSRDSEGEPCLYGSCTVRKESAVYFVCFGAAQYGCFA
jgi:hypothetical protein